LPLHRIIVCLQRSVKNIRRYDALKRKKGDPREGVALLRPT
jgi:hypothetical protein